MEQKHRFCQWISQRLQLNGKAIKFNPVTSVDHLLSLIHSSWDFLDACCIWLQDFAGLCMNVTAELPDACRGEGQDEISLLKSNSELAIGFIPISH